MKKASKKSVKSTPQWNLGLLYKSVTDPQIEKDMQKIEQLDEAFSKKYDTPEKKYLSDSAVLLNAIKDLEELRIVGDKPGYYFYYLRDLEAENKAAISNMALLDNRLSKSDNKTKFFSVLLGKVSAAKQKEFLTDPLLAPYKIFLQRIFSDAKYRLSVDEEKIMSLKSLPAYDMWVSGNKKVLNMQSVPWKGKSIPVEEANKIVQSLPTQKERAALSAAISKVMKQVASFSEAEMNAVITNKKINDELRGYKTAYENTVLGYRNDPAVVDKLVETVKAGFPIAQRFYKLKARLLKQKNLIYADRTVKIGKTASQYPFEKSVKILQETFGKLDPKYARILGEYVNNGQIDVAPRIGKTGGAYCSGSYSLPTFVLLNHTNDLDALKTLAHEMGHAFHTEASRSQGPIYMNYSTSLAETASTLFEYIALDAIFDSLPDKEKVVVLHDKINGFISTIFRQVACFNFEKELHETIRAKGFMSKEEIADAHNRNMQAYLGPTFKLTQDDGYFFVQWGHIRRFFYVYSYAYGLLVSSALLRRYKQDPSFWKKIELFLAAGGKDSPENILREIGIDVSSPEFWKEGLKEIEDDIKKLEKLTAKK